jgi:hypothetical protein
MNYKLFDEVALCKNVPKHGLTKGALGIVVEIYPATDGLEVEFFDKDGETVTVLTLDAADVSIPETAKSSGA